MNMITSFALVLALALALVVGGGVTWAREDLPYQETTKTKFWGATYQEYGLVMGVDAVTGKLSVKDKIGKVRKFSAMKAKVTSVEGKVLSLADISIGDEVSISYKGRSAIEVFRLHQAAKK